MATIRTGMSGELTPGFESHGRFQDISSSFSDSAQPRQQAHRSESSRATSVPSSGADSGARQPPTRNVAEQPALKKPKSRGGRTKAVAMRVGDMTPLEFTSFSNENYAKSFTWEKLQRYCQLMDLTTYGSKDV
eukprot:CAMPEP_0197332728 /NCGR_PEP_ID=MMETSP0892-20130614/20761_1 /TAXON_ID=44058 ORGANISM="Aureoumbra lagunensis, Strain CCMP1510" /NCGR_SAMPLE_ID=MMETSP0892 /ASSEMBLY_ACC=CAM_ASM_000538 /LENGTH=132 /DNA_ID=CAMNT_0042831805 /DNA_START=360 /DNA_END=754 /DNA_ORIENTATION=+